MAESLTVVDWSLCGLAAVLVLLALYTHIEGNRVTATRFAYQDIRREMGSHPPLKVWWRAFTIAMGWRKSSRSSTRPNVTTIRNNVTPMHAGVKPMRAGVTPIRRTGTH